MFFDQEGQPEATVDFPYDEIDRRLSSPESPPIRVDGEGRLLRTILEWVADKVPRHGNGLEIRATIAAWIFLPYLRGYTMTELAAMIGRDKQSVGRWVDDFRRTFPGVLPYSK
jgi:hypothetical protein